MAQSIFELIAEEAKKSQQKKREQNERAKAQAIAVFPWLENIMGPSRPSPAVETQNIASKKEDRREKIEVSSDDYPKQKEETVMGWYQPKPSDRDLSENNSDHRPLAWLGGLILLFIIFVLPVLSNEKYRSFEQIVTDLMDYLDKL